MTKPDALESIHAHVKKFQPITLNGKDLVTNINEKLIGKGDMPCMKCSNDVQLANPIPDTLKQYYDKTIAELRDRVEELEEYLEQSYYDNSKDVERSWCEGYEQGFELRTSGRNISPKAE